MPPVKKNNAYVPFRASDDVRARLRHHAVRLGTDMNDIVRESVVTYLEILDDRERRARELKRNRERSRIMPSGPVPAGLGLSKPNKVSLASVPKKIERSFRRFAEYLEAATDEKDRVHRSQTIVNEIKERVDNNTGEIDAATMAFSDFLRQRAEHKSEIAVSADAVIEGDVEE